MSIVQPVLSLEPGGILKHSCSPVDKNFHFDLPETRLIDSSEIASPSIEKPSTNVRRVVTFSMPSGAKWKTSQSSLRLSLFRWKKVSFSSLHSLYFIGF